MMSLDRRQLIGGLALVLTAPARGLAADIPAPAPHPVRAKVGQLRITVLDTMVAGSSGLDGEWGFAALMEADGRRILYDTGASPDRVLHNVRTLNLDLSDVEDVILSHNHDDHTAGLLTLRREFARQTRRRSAAATWPPASSRRGSGPMADRTATWRT